MIYQCKGNNNCFKKVYFCYKTTIPQIHSDSTHMRFQHSHTLHTICLHTVISKTYDIRLFIQLLHTSTEYKQNILLLPYIQRALSSILNLSNNILAHTNCCMCWYYKINTTSTSLETNVCCPLPEYCTVHAPHPCRPNPSGV